MDTKEDKILITGTSGYVGGRLFKILENDGYALRCLVRNRSKELENPLPSTEITFGDATDIDSLRTALKGIHTAFYLIHSLGDASNFESIEEISAKNFAKAASENGVKRIIYLGGLSSENVSESPHLRSRRLVGEILRNSQCTVIEFRASIVIGSGGISFEIIRALVDRLPVMITPKWVSSLAQPIGIDDLLDYLKSSISMNFTQNEIIEIGGPDIVSYGQLMKEYAKQMNLKRLMISVPVLTPRLSSLWLGLVTPIYSRIGRKLIDSLKYPSVINNNIKAELFNISPSSIDVVIAKAILDYKTNVIPTKWSDSISSSGLLKRYSEHSSYHMLIDSREIYVNTKVENAFYPIQTIGGNNGWYAWNFLWRIRGFIDLLFGGVGLRRGRSHPLNLLVGSTIDWWRVESYIPNKSLRLYAEMKVPGQAWLQFDVEPSNQGAIIKQTAEFFPNGILGKLYWYLLLPLHKLVFVGLLNGIARHSKKH